MDFIEYKTLKKLGIEFKDRLNSIAKNDNGITGIPSGFHKLDAITKGFQPSNLILIGGAEGMGKTEFAVSLISKMTIENQCPTAFFTLEMTAQQFMIQIIKQQTNISAEKLRLGLLNENEIELVSKKSGALENIPLYVYDYPLLTVSDIEDVLSLSPPDFAEIIVIDSLELLTKNKKDPVGKVLNKRELTKISFQLKKLAEKFNITIVVLFHFRLPKEKLKYYYTKRPILADIRKHAPIDTYADVVLLLYRPEYYKIDGWDDNEQLPTAGEAEIIVAKNSLGSLGNARVKFERDKGIFDNLY
jgi:replicative DNA helicase